MFPSEDLKILRISMFFLILPEILDEPKDIGPFQISFWYGLAPETPLTDRYKGW